MSFRSVVVRLLGDLRSAFEKPLPPSLATASADYIVLGRHLVLVSGVPRDRVLIAPHPPVVSARRGLCGRRSAENRTELADRDQAAADEHHDGRRDPKDPLPSALRHCVQEDTERAVADDKPDADTGRGLAAGVPGSSGDISESARSVKGDGLDSPPVRTFVQAS